MLLGKVVLTVHCGWYFSHPWPVVTSLRKKLRHTNVESFAQCQTAIKQEAQHLNPCLIAGKACGSVHIVLCVIARFDLLGGFSLANHFIYYNFRGSYL